MVTMCLSLRHHWSVERRVCSSTRSRLNVVIEDQRDWFCLIACNQSLDSSKLVTSWLHTDSELANILHTTAKYFSKMRKTFSVWTALQKKPDTVESATANEDNLSRFMSKLQGFFSYYFYESFNLRLGCSTSVCSLIRYNAHLQSFDKKKKKKLLCS